MTNTGINGALASKREKARKTLLALVILLAASVVVSVLSGPARISLPASPDEMTRRILYMRLSRTVLAIIVGGGLSVSGVILQGLLRNPLCEPYVLGISGGASVGAVAAIAVGGTWTVLGLSVLPLWAFAGAAVTFFVVYRIAEVNGRVPIQNLLLTGVIVGAVLSSIVVFIVSFSEKETLHSVMWWLLGNLQIFDNGLLLFVCLIVLAGSITAAALSNELNAFSLGEEEAIHAGVETERMKKIFFLIASLITGACVSAAGMIGFLGLIVPHFMRMVTGHDHKVLIPASFFAGGIFLVLCDTLARTVMSPSEVPVGVITAVCGAPFFINMLRNKSRF